ncbi:3-hydroxyacyl-CoA dehyrogenase [Aspergillus ustus]|uniref:3-hydroxyacyl-CoA dehyrogenase n=1 Tax=Aspergillus ustus TaxID=40382 RepID=A0A0C1E5I7_ASPUT|nr:3-hydroxyacyl-CoA dehyrogenase [Aspergillus ustus]
MIESQRPQGSVVIIGAGTQGRRLAYMWSSRGGLVYLVDLNQRQLEEGLQYVEQLRMEAQHSGTWGDVRLATPDSLESLLHDSWLVVECVPENLALKRKVLTQLDKLAPESTIIASNSSSYGIGEIIEGLTLTSCRRLLSAHCYWPPETSAIEIMGHNETDPSLINLLYDQCEKHGFSPFRVRQSSIGYIYNRIWAAIKRETLLALSEGICEPQEIDAIFKDVLKTPKGPCEQMDIVGLDVVLDIENHYAEARSGLPSEPRDYLQKMIKEETLGVKSGRGFYDYKAQNRH